MLESKSYYSQFDECRSKPYGWCVKVIADGADHGCIGFHSRKAAEKWLKDISKLHEEGRYFPGIAIEKTEIYYAG